MEYEFLVISQKGIIDTVYYLLNTGTRLCILPVSASQCMALQTDYTLIKCDASSLAPWIWSYVTAYSNGRRWRACSCVLAQSVLAVLCRGMTVWTRHRDYKRPLWRGMGLTGSDTCCSHPAHSVLAVEWLLETLRLLLLLKCLPHISSYNRSIIS